MYLQRRHVLSTAALPINAYARSDGLRTFRDRQRLTMQTVRGAEDARAAESKGLSASGGAVARGSAGARDSGEGAIGLMGGPSARGDSGSAARSSGVPWSGTVAMGGTGQSTISRNVAPGYDSAGAISH
jgi:hypothetical protein